MNIHDFIKVIRSGSAGWPVTLNLTKDRYGNDITTVYATDNYSGIQVQLSEFSASTHPLTVSRFLDSYNIRYTVHAFLFPALLVKYGFASGDLKSEQQAEQPKQTLKRCRICKKAAFKTPLNCANALESLDGWQCQLNTEFVGTARVSPTDLIIFRGVA